MRTQERLRAANEQIAHALTHARKARQRLLYNEKDTKVLTDLNAAIAALENKKE